MIRRLTVSSDCLPVSGSTELTSNGFCPRRNSTVALQSPSASALTEYGSRPGVAIETVAPAVVVPRMTYSVAPSSTSTTATAGFDTAIVGGFANRSNWTPRYAAKASTAIRPYGGRCRKRRSLNLYMRFRSTNASALWTRLGTGSSTRKQLGQNVETFSINLGILQSWARRFDP